MYQNTLRHTLFCILSQCIENLINFENIYASTYQKTLLRTLSCLFLKS